MQKYDSSDRRHIAKLKRLSSPNRLSRVCRFRRQAERGLPRPRTLPVGIPFESRVLPTRLYFFPCAPARNRFALRRRSLLPKAFAPAATWTCLCSRSSRTGGWLHSRYRETSASPYQKEGMIARPRSEHLIFLSVGRSGRQLRDSRSYAMVLGDLRRCKTAFSYRASRNYLWCWGGYATSHNNPLSHARGQSLPDSARRRVCALY